MISIILPTRSRPDKSAETTDKWLESSSDWTKLQLIVSIDEDDPELETYQWIYHKAIVNKNRSCVDAINNAAKVATGDIFIVVSDDTDCFKDWDLALLKEVEGKSDYLLKTKDGIQDYIVTMTVMDRTYYERDGFIYHSDFKHQFADTYLTCVADIRGRLIKSDLVFPHKHYSHLKESPDALNVRNDATWKEGQDTFVRLMKQFTPEERARIKDPGMKNWLRNHGVR